ncbi:MAG: Hpt domain-containing protein [Gemmataceae bacterium]|nr:Hpt domain-containing protein [Gemmataceae bacterium]
MADLTGAAKRRDGAALQIAANRLHRSFASIGATSARQIAEELEQAGDRNAIGEAESKLAGLRFEVDQLAKSMICR